MEKIIKRVFDVSREQKVDLMVAKAKVFEELNNNGSLNSEQFDKAEKFINKYEAPLCREYAKTGFINFDAERFIKELEENEKN